MALWLSRGQSTRSRYRPQSAILKNAIDIYKVDAYKYSIRIDERCGRVPEYIMYIVKRVKSKFKTDVTVQ